jgi:hypothetical protein
MALSLNLKDDWREAWEDGNRLYGLGEFKAALLFYDRSLVLSPSESRILNKKRLGTSAVRLNSAARMQAPDIGAA